MCGGFVISIMLQSKARIFKRIFFRHYQVGLPHDTIWFQYAGDTSVAGVTEYMEQRVGRNM